MTASTVNVDPSATGSSGVVVPNVQADLPGPKARAIIARDQRVSSPSLTRGNPLVADSAVGMVVSDVDGNTFLDFAAGIAVCASGHSHPAVVAAMVAQAGRLIHIASNNFYEPRYIEFIERLAAIAPFKEDARVYLTNSGTESVEGAIKLARYHTGRPGIVAFEGAFHGRTLGALSLTNSKLTQRAGLGPLLPMVHHAPYPRIRPWREESGGDGSREIGILKRDILGRLIAPRDVAAIVVEPIQGEGGYFPAPASFLQALREICDEHGILLIADEIQSGMGRTGSWWAIDASGIEPDIITTAKGIASGMPIGAVIARDSVWTWPPGAHGSTFGGNPICAAAGLATLDVIEEALRGNVASMGQRLRSGLEAVAAAAGDDQVRDVRGTGLMLAVEFREHDHAASVQRAAFERGLLILECGESALRFTPPLIVDEASVDTAVRIFGEACTAVSSSAPSSSS